MLFLELLMWQSGLRTVDSEHELWVSDLSLFPAFLVKSLNLSDH